MGVGRYIGLDAPGVKRPVRRGVGPTGTVLRAGGFATMVITPRPLSHRPPFPPGVLRLTSEPRRQFQQVPRIAFHELRPIRGHFVCDAPPIVQRTGASGVHLFRIGSGLWVGRDSHRSRTHGPMMPIPTGPPLRSHFVSTRRATYCQAASRPRAFGLGVTCWPAPEVPAKREHGRARRPRPDSGR